MAVYNFTSRGSFFGTADTVREFTAGGTFAAQDLVNVVSGKVVIANAGDALAGVAREAAVNNTTGVAVNVTPWLTGVMGNDNVGTTFGSTHPGARFDIVGTTGAMQVDTSTVDTNEAGATGQLVCLEYNPNVSPYAADTTVGLFMIAEHQFYGI